MKCKPLALRVLSTAAMLSIVASCTAPAFAATYDLSNGDVSVSAEADGYQYVSQWTDEDHTTFTTDENGAIDHRKDNDVTLTSNGQETSNTITVSADKDQTANVTLDDVNIDTRDDKNNVYSTGDAAMAVKGEGDVTVELNGKNKLTSGNSHAGLEKNLNESSGTLTIQDSKNDDGTPKSSTSNDTTGSLTATGGAHAAGIGGGVSDDNSDSTADEKYSTGTSNISITGGDITAEGGILGAGIGGGGAGMYATTGKGSVDEDVSNIHISGGTLTAAGGEGGSGIGGGSYNHGSVSDISISNVKDATIEGSYFAAGIGNGYCAYDWVSLPYGTVSNIKISDSNVNIKVSNGGVGIGANYKSTLEGDTVSITGTSDVTITEQNKYPLFHDTYHIKNSNFVGKASFYASSSDGTQPIPLDGSETDITAPCEGKVTYVNEDGTIEKVISGKGHTWGEWETVKEATETDTGLQQRVCQVCGKVEQRELPKLTPAEPDPAPVPTPVPPTDDKPTDNGTETQTSSEDLWVEAPDGIPQTFTVTQNGSVRTYTSPYDSGTLTGSLEVLQKLQESGTDTITFVTNQRTSSFKIADLLALGSDGEMLALSHMDAAAPTLTVAGADHTALLF